MAVQVRFIGQAAQRLPLLAGLGLGLVTITIVAAASLRDPKSLDVLEAGPGAASGFVVSPDGSGAPFAGPAGDRATAEPSPLAPEADLDKATDAAALEKLAEQFPKDPKVARKLLVAYSDDARALPQSVVVAKRLLELDPSTSHDEVVKRTLAKGASGPPTVAETAFQAMKGSMGSDGPDLLFELATASTTPAPAKDRAWKALAEPGVRELASPALRVAIDLKKATACERRPLLAAAEHDGDKRSLSYLEPLVVAKGCGFLGMGDCYGCFGNRTELIKTITAIKSR